MTDDDANLAAPADHWLELSTRVDNEAVEAVCEAFRRFVHGGVVVERVVESQEHDWVDEVDASSLAIVPVVVRGYLPLDAQTDARRRSLEEALWHLNAIWPVGQPASRVIREEDWANSWKAHFQVHRVGRRFVIRPPWQPYDAGEGDVVIDLDPGMAFGTGLHPTTQMCLLAIEEVIRPGMRVLDLGTGSGILAIAMAKLGATVLALDVDPIAVRVATQNVAANKTDEAVRVEQGSLPSPREIGVFDVVVANIIARVIEDLAFEFAPIIVPDGHLVASGIIADREPTVVARLNSAGWTDLNRRQHGDWVSLVGARQSE
jgi:ribosomal protein L11 methyltransferase